jgi:hypothetical protein
MMSAVWISVVIPLALAELSGWAAWLATKVARRAARRLGESDADVRQAQEITAAVPAPLTRLVTAVGLLAVAPALRRGSAYRTRNADARSR